MFLKSQKQRYEYKLDIVFLRFVCFLITITLRQKPKGVTSSRRWTGTVPVELQDRELACSTPTTRNSFGLLYNIIVNAI